MPSMEAVFIGDFHSGSLAGVFPEMLDPDDMIYRAVEQIIKYARENAIKHIIFLGDLFETPDPTQDQQRRLTELLIRLNKMGFIVDLIPGNHDFKKEGEVSLSLVDFIARLQELKVNLHLKPTLKKLSGVPFCFLPWPYYNKAKAGIKHEGPTVNIAHVSVSGAVRDNGTKVGNEGVTLDTSRDFWIIGHLHRQQGSKRAVYPGNFFQKNFGEPLPKGFMHGTFTLKNGALRVKHKWIPVAVPFELHTIKVTSVDDLSVIKADTDHCLYRYKLHKQADVALPAKYDPTRHPQILEVRGWKTKREIEALEQSGIALQTTILDDKDLIFADLQEFLKERGLNKAERKQAFRIVEQIAIEEGLLLER